MAKKKTSTELAAQAVQSVVRQPIFIINNAPYLRDAPEDSEEAHRGNTGWIIAIPALRIAVPIVDRNGKPKTGFFDDSEARAQAEAIWRQCMNDPEVLKQYQDEYAWPDTFVEGHKIMQRFISVPNL
ncbi:MAG: hypothetical protein DRJ03_26260 [Chloroflexi bacterium]|nr:MAG: hypothetical protein DRJ03_26260 [Chloroflexota bacterium]